MAPWTARANQVWGVLLVIATFTSYAYLALALVLVNPLRYCGPRCAALRHALRVWLVRMGWTPVFGFMYVSGFEARISNPQQYFFPGRDRYLPAAVLSQFGLIPDYAGQLQNMNHQSYCDTFIISYLCHALGCADGANMWVIWISFLAWPLGWASYMADHLFVHKKTMQVGIDGHMKHLSENFKSMNIYVEGTVREEGTIVKSDAYCKELGMEPFENVMYPRSGMVKLALPHLRKNGVKHFVDYTIGYPEGCDFLLEPRSITNLGKVRRPELPISLLVRVYPLDDLGSTAEDIDKFLVKVYREKDAALKAYKKQGSFPDEEVVASKRTMIIADTAVWLVLCYGMTRLLLAPLALLW